MITSYSKNYLSLFFIGLMLNLMVGCNDDDKTPVTPVTPSKSLLDRVQDNPELSTLTSLLAKYPDLTSTLSTDGQMTVFAPNNAAFTVLLDTLGQNGTAANVNNIPADVLKRLLQYHVVTGEALEASSLKDGQQLSTALKDNPVKVGVTNGEVSINGAKVSTTDTKAGNGILHILDAVLMPELEGNIVNTVLEPAYFNKDYASLSAALTAAGLVETLTDKEKEFTVFAPDNTAFTSALGVLDKTLDELLADKPLLTRILNYHVLTSEVKSSALPKTNTKAYPFAAAVQTSAGEGSFFYLTNRGEGVFINGNSKVTATDIEADNGVVHTINGVLIPETADIVTIAQKAGFNKLAEALTEADLISTLKEDGSFTVFAPTDTAFMKAYSLLGVDGPEDIKEQTLKDILLYHVIGENKVFSTDLLDGAEPATATTGGTKVKINVNDNISLTDKDEGTTDAQVIKPNVLAGNGVIHSIDAVLLPRQLTPQ